MSTTEEATATRAAPYIMPDITRRIDASHSYASSAPNEGLASPDPRITQAAMGALANLDAETTSLSQRRMDAINSVLRAKTIIPGVIPLFTKDEADYAFRIFEILNSLPVE